MGYIMPFMFDYDRRQKESGIQESEKERVEGLVWFFGLMSYQLLTGYIMPKFHSFIFDYNREEEEIDRRKRKVWCGLIYLLNGITFP